MPAAGRATRLGEMESSKEVLVVGGEPVCFPLLRGWAEAGIERARGLAACLPSDIRTVPRDK